MPKHSKSYYLELLHNANVQAYLMTIRRGEGTLGAKGYYTHFGGGLLSTLNNLPEFGKAWTKGNKHKRTSSAVGAYQFLNTKKHRTLKEIVSYFNFTDFSKQNQDLGALFLLDRRGALSNILKGEILSAFRKTNSEWTTLLGSKKDQPTQNLGDALKFNKDVGGRLYGHNYIGEYGWHMLFDIKRMNEDAWGNLQDYGGLKKASTKLNLTHDLQSKDNNLNRNAKIIGALSPMGIQGSLLGLGLLKLGKFIEEHLSKLKIPHPKLKRNNKSLGDVSDQSENQDKFSFEDWDSKMKWGVNTNEVLSIDKQLSLQDKAIYPSLLSQQMIPGANNPDNLEDAFFSGSLYDGRKYGYPKLINSYPKRYENALFSSSNTLTTVNARQNPEGFDYKVIKPGRQLSKQPAQAERGRTIQINLNRAMIENFSIHTSNAKEGLVDFKEKVEEVLIEILSNANAIQ